MKISIDFGSAYIKVAYPDNNRHDPLLFYYPNERAGNFTIATEICYGFREGGDSRYISWEARDHLNDATRNEYLRGIRSKLLEPANVYPDKSRSPLRIVWDYFDELLITGRYPFRERIGEPEQVIVTLPDKWYSEQENNGFENLVKVFDGFDSFKGKIEIASEAVSAAAYYNHYVYPKRDYNLLVCDMGAGTFDVSLCQIENNVISILYHDHSNQEGEGLAGTTFDKNCVSAAVVAGNRDLPKNDDDLCRLYRSFETQKIEKSDEARLLNETHMGNQHFPGTVIYEFDDFEVTAAQAWQAFIPIREEICKVLQRVKEKVSQNQWKVDRIFIVGGFSQFSPVEQSIKDCFPEMNLEENFSEPLVNERSSAVAKGAFQVMLGSQGMAFFKHSVGIFTHGLVNGVLMREEIIIVRANQVRKGMVSPTYLSNLNGEHTLVEIPEKHEAGLLPVFLKRNGTDQTELLTMPDLLNCPAPGIYAVAFQIDRFGCFKLILEDSIGKEQTVYLLGNFD